MSDISNLSSSPDTAPRLLLTRRASLGLGGAAVGLALLGVPSTAQAATEVPECLLDVR